ncbi:MAG TPA: serine/threonine-protein kinase [Candidatus Krumholzibacteria bacterium]|nr:serine/threonine-protein kinase [Candidatus Krumholzibacteria bacterium]
MAIKVAIEGYDELEQIGVGGMAAVYRARKVSIDKIVAIKLLFPYLATDESYIERFQREAKAAASIQHENIVNVIDFGESDGAFYIVMEYYDGGTLEQLMKDRPGLPPEVAIRILLEVAYGLEAAHARDIVHRDVKPANIIVTNQGAVKIADFGLARKSDSETMITQQGKVVGTPAYMSPEQAAGRNIGPASDIFSFGVVAYELLSRRKPFEGQSYSDVLEKIQTFEPSRVGIVNPLIPMELETVVKRCLEKSESARYKDAGELVLALEAAMESGQIARDRRQLAAYVKDPERYDAAFAEKTITECLARGASFMLEGRSHLEEAVLEYRRVLFLDPSHEHALSSLDKLRAEKGENGERGEGARTVMMDAVHAASGSPYGNAGTTGRTRKLRPWMLMAAAVVVLIPGLLVFNSRARLADRAAQQASLRAAGPATTPVESPVPSDSSLLAATQSKVEQEKKTTPVTMSASSFDAGVTKLTDSIAENKTPVNTGITDAKKATARTEPKVSEPVTKPAHEVAMGSLSVYFLGGVGNVWVDGKLFPHQPPFDKVVLAAGMHRVSCRMSEDKESHELTITVRPGADTVVEYEVGGAPVVSDE